MTNATDFYPARAEAFAQAARETKLEDVRARHLQSERVWRAMVARLIQGKGLRMAATAQRGAAS